MKVVLATHFFPPSHAGGTEAYTLGLAMALRRLGHEPFVVCAERWDQGDRWQPRHEDTLYEGLPVRRLSWNWQLAPDPFVNAYDNPAVERHLAGYLADLRPDVVHVTSCYTLGAGAVRAARALGRPTFLTLTDFWFLCPRHTLRRGDGSLCGGPESALACQRCLATGSRVFESLERVMPADLAARGLLELSHWPRLARRPGLRGYVGDSGARLARLRDAFAQVDVALAPSRFLMDVFVRNGYPADRLRHWPYGIDVAWRSELRPRPPGARLCVGYIGQIEPIKGVDLLVRAFRSLPADLPADLRVFGGLAKNPGYAAELTGLAGGDRRITFEGAFERARIAEVLSQVDLLVVPSIWYENTPVVILEAFAAGKPVIASDLGGLSELVEHERNGLLFRPGDAADLAAAIRRLVEDGALREQLRARTGVVRTVDAEARELVRLYEAAVGAVAA